MNSEFGAFALRQMLASTAVIGPILILIGLCYYLFKQDRKSVLIYVSLGVVCTIVGLACLYSEFRDEKGAREEAVIPAQK